LTAAALTMAIQRQKPSPSLIHHSDRGRQCAAADYRKVLGVAGMIQSMSRKGNCWDTAPIESCFGGECQMEHTRFIGLDIHKERISIAVVESGRSGAVEYIGEISNDPGAISKLCDRLRLSGQAFCYEAGRAVMTFVANSQASAIGAMWWRRSGGIHRRDFQ
jgi:transposase InsO family protein